MPTLPSLRKQGTPLAFATAIIIVILLGILFATGTLRIPRGPLSTMDFALRQKVSAASNLHFSFPELMDHTSAEEAMTVPEGVKGSWSWADNVLIFDPSENLPAGKTLTFHLDNSAQRSDGTPLGRDLDFVFVVAGPPEVRARIPSENAVGIADSSKITLVFDRPMIPLTQVQGDFAQARTANWPVTISPEVKGRWRWLSTVAVEYVPESGLPLNTRYTVTVPKGLTSVTGDATEKDFSWSFETQRPELVSTEPEKGTSLAGPTTEVQLHFNQNMDPKRAKDALTLKQESAEGAASALPLPFTVRSGTMKIDGKSVTDPTTLVLKPAKPFSFKTAYTVTIPSGLQSKVGDLGTTSSEELRFATVGDMTFLSGTYENYGIHLRFSNPVNADSLPGQIAIQPEIEGWKDVEWTVSTWEDNVEIFASPSLKPSTTYTVSLLTGIADSYGQRLGKAGEFTFTTASLPPQVSIRSKGEFGIFERGNPPLYPISTVNVKTLHLEFASLTLPDFLQLRSTKLGNWDAALSLAGNKDYRAWDLAVTKEKDAWNTTLLDLEKEAGRTLSSGIYALSVRSPEYKKEWGDRAPIVQYQFFALTNIALTLKYSGDHALVWATNMQTGDPVQGAEIGFHSLNGTTVLTGATDARGFFETPLDLKSFTTPQNEWEPEFWVTAQKGNDFAFVSSQWNEGIRSGAFDIWTDFRNAQAGSERVQGYLYTERPLYRAGDTVFFKGIVRMLGWDGTFGLPEASRSVTVSVRDPNGNEIFNKNLPLSAFGSFHGELPIDPDAALGNYGISAVVLPEGDLVNPNLWANFSVLAYRKPEYKVEVTTEKEEYFNHDSVQATIAGSYYFGAPMDGAAVSWRAQTTDYFFNKVTDGWYSFALEEGWCWERCDRQTENIAQGTGKLDASGRFAVSIPAIIDAKAVSQILTIEADITDQNNQVVSNRISVPVHKADAYVGIRSDDYVVTPGEEASVSLITVKPDGSPLPGQDVRLQLFSRTWNTIRKKGVDGEYYYDNEPKDTFIRNFSATTNEEGKATARVKIDSGGGFRIVATVKDGSGREARAGTSVYAWSDTYINWPHANNDKIDVVADKPTYKVGDTAKLLIKSPYQGKGVKALVTVERENILDKKVIDITSNAQPIEIPVTAEMLPNVYVSVVVVKPRIGETFDENGKDAGAPAYKLGYVQLKVDTEQKRLSVLIEPDKEQYLPGEKVTVTLTTTDRQGKPVPAELSLGTVDMSLLALSGFELPDLVEQFYNRRGLGVYTAEMLMYLIERYKPGSKGGGGGENLEERVRGTFKDTAYWNPKIVTNAEGKATISFTLPDNLTTWHLLAIGSTKTHTFGAAEKTIVETKRVILRPVRPRFAVVGDQVTLGAIVHNFLPTKETFSVSLTGSGFTALDAPVKKVTVDSGGQQKLLFPVVIQPGNSVSLRFLAENPAARDEIVESFPVSVFGTPQTVATTGVTEDVVTEKVLVPTERDADRGTVTATVSPTLATYLPSALDYLLTFPYGCAEQTLSSFLPSIALTRLQGFDAFQVADRQKLEKIVTAGLERLSTFQRSDGGFGYWTESDRSYPYLSAYALHALSLTRDAGYSVDQSMIDRTRNYLDEALRHTDPTDEMYLNPASRAYVLFVLSETGKGDVSLLANLYEQRKQLPLFAKAYLAMALQHEGARTSVSKATSLLTDIQNAAKVDGRGTHFEEENDYSSWSTMHTNDRTTAIVLQAMIRIDPENVLVPNIVRSLLANREDGHWDTTQATAQALLALTDFLRQTKELDASYTAAVDVNGRKVLEESFDKKNVLTRKSVELALDDLLRGQENEIRIGKEGKKAEPEAPLGVGRLYYDLVLSYFYTAPTIPPAEEGLSILRSIEPLSGQAKEPTVGNTYRVTLTITAPEDRHFVAVSSPLPAGMEAIDLSLQTAQKTLLSDSTTAGSYWSEDYWQSGIWRFSHHEFRDDSVFLFAENLPAGVYQYTYLVRATTPGTFRERPARVWEMYFPEIFGQTEGKLMIIKE
ncbi:MAG: Ig-like domain-containing protein [Candidatus Peribacteraceae bacterium]|nr:Ig-like domain-containing protein [Candidatus Peribacteraceae bacterium]